MFYASLVCLHLVLNVVVAVDTVACIGLCSVLRPHQHSIGYTGHGFYSSKDPTNSIKVLKENLQKKITQRTKKTQNTHACTQNG